MTLYFEPIWSSWWLAALVAVSLLVILLTTYRQSIAHLPVRTQRVLLAMRLLAWLVLVFLMFRPTLEWIKKDKQPALFVVVTDSSRSMTVHDGPAGATRREALLATLREQAGELDALGKEVKIQHYELAEDLRPVTEHSAEAKGDQSAYGKSLENLLKLNPGQRIARVLLMGDGAQRAVAPFDADPRAAARLLADAQVAVDTVLYGATGFTETSVDLGVDELEVSPTVFVKNTVVAGAKVRALGATGRPITARLLIEDPSQNKPGQPAAMKLACPPVVVTTNQPVATIPIEFHFPAEQAGEFKLTLELVPLDNEPLLLNNTVSTFLSVLKGGVNVAYFDTVRPEQKFIRLINESPDIQVDYKPIRAGDLLDKNRIEADLFTPGRYDVYIIGDVPAKVFGPAMLNRLQKAVDQGAGLLMIGGFENFGAGGYAETPLADLLPVLMVPAEQRSGREIDPAQHVLEPVRMLPTTTGLQDFVMRLDAPEKNLDRWKSLSMLQGANRFAGLKPVARVLAQTEQGLPLLAAQDVGRGRSMAFAADTTYQWVLNGHREDHQRFWQQMILWRAHKELQGDDAVWVRLASRRIRRGQPVEMTVGARDGEKKPIEDATFLVEVTAPDGQVTKLPVQKVATDFLSRYVDTSKPGEYRVNVTATRNGQTIGSGAFSRFLVYEQDLELNNPAADRSLLEEISKLTAGVVITPEQLGDHLRQLRKNGLLTELEQVTTVPLWDHWLVLLIYVTLLTVEWIWRKTSGLV